MRSLMRAVGSVKVSTETRREIFDFVKTILWFAVIFFGLRTFVVEGYEIQGNSMEPTLEDHQRLFVLKFTYRFDDVERGDVIVFRYPEDLSRRFIKRVIGLPGDTVEIREDEVLINEKALDEPYLNEDFVRPYRESPKVTVPQDCYYVLGDHRSVSSDSRAGWFVPRENIVGKAALRFWPLTKFSVL